MTIQQKQNPPIQNLLNHYPGMAAHLFGDFVLPYLDLTEARRLTAVNKKLRKCVLDALEPKPPNTIKQLLHNTCVLYSTPLSARIVSCLKIGFFYYSEALLRDEPHDLYQITGLNDSICELPSPRDLNRKPQNNAPPEIFQAIFSHNEQFVFKAQLRNNLKKALPLAAAEENTEIVKICLSRARYRLFPVTEADTLFLSCKIAIEKNHKEIAEILLSSLVNLLNAYNMYAGSHHMIRFRTEELILLTIKQNDADLVDLLYNKLKNLNLAMIPYLIGFFEKSFYVQAYSHGNALIVSRLKKIFPRSKNYLIVFLSDALHGFIRYRYNIPGGFRITPNSLSPRLAANIKNSAIEFYLDEIIQFDAAGQYISPDLISCFLIITIAADCLSVIIKAFRCLPSTFLVNHMRSLICSLAGLGQEKILLYLLKKQSRLIARNDIQEAFIYAIANRKINTFQILLNTNAANGITQSDLDSGLIKACAPCGMKKITLSDLIIIRQLLKTKKHGGISQQSPTKALKSFLDYVYQNRGGKIPSDSLEYKICLELLSRVSQSDLDSFYQNSPKAYLLTPIIWENRVIQQNHHRLQVPVSRRMKLIKIIHSQINAFIKKMKRLIKFFKKKKHQGLCP